MVLCALFGKNIYVPINLTWSDAKKYCRDHYTDLSSITSSVEDEELSKAGYEHLGRAWIGLYKDANETWMWSGAKSASFFKWSATNNASEDNRCVAHSTDGWLTMNCDQNKLEFYCFQSSLVLVKKNNTWEEAMEHCRNQNRNLVNVSSETALVRSLQTIRVAQTDHVWMGLRYLAGSWLWVHGNTYHKMPQCPAWSHSCGALSIKGKTWYSWDCADKLNFVCY
uniref:C-type lectin domain-containing protein n=2 Tax=Anabas testudineus TaxID=64144 RepID=A0A3Q1KIM0_ANATE